MRTKKDWLSRNPEDALITRMGRLLRKCRLDELPQLFNVIAGDMSFVGTRPEVKKYVDEYTEEVYATLLLPAGITSRTSIAYKDEDEVMVSQSLRRPEKCGRSLCRICPAGKDALESALSERIQRFFGDFKIMIDTVLAVLK